MRKRVRFLLILPIVLIGIWTLDYARSQVFIGPASGPNITFTATPETISGGDSSLLKWSSPTADVCKEPGGWFFNDPTSGSKVVSPSSTTDYKVSCRNSSGTRLDTVTVRVERCPFGNSCHGETVDVKINGSDGPLKFSSLPVTLDVVTTVTSNDPWWAVFSPDVNLCRDWESNKILYGPGTYNRSLTLNDPTKDYGVHPFPVTCQFDTSADSIRDNVDVIIEKPTTTYPKFLKINLTVNKTVVNVGEQVTLTAAGQCNNPGYPTFYFYDDRNDAGTNITPASQVFSSKDGWLGDVNIKQSRTYSYAKSGTYIAKVIVKQGESVTEDRVTIKVVSAPPPPINNPPTGYHDAVNNNTCSTSGWARDADTPNTPVTVHIYVDKPAGSGNQPIAATIADKPRTEASWPYPDRNHGFDVSLPSLKDGANHPLYAYPIDTTTGLGNPSNPLTLSPKTIQCSKPVSAPGKPLPSVDIKVQ